MRTKRWLLNAALAACTAAGAWAGTFGRVVPIGGHASDIALDEKRGVLYIANFTMHRIDVMSLATSSIERSMTVAQQPGSITLSPDGRYLIATHYGAREAPTPSDNSLTLIDLETNGRQTYSFGGPPYGAAFGIDGRALVVTSTEFLLFDPASGATEQLESISDVVVRTLPAKLNSWPSNIVASSIGVSRDGLVMYGILSFNKEDTQNIEFAYDVTSHALAVFFSVTSPPYGPRVVSVNEDGSLYLAGWAITDARTSAFITSQFPDADGRFQIGTHVFDTLRNVIYAQFTSKPKTIAGQTATTAQTEPLLMVMDVDNLYVREQWRIPENFAGRSLMTADNSTLYGISESGILIVPVGSLNRVPRLRASKEDVVFRANFCDRRTITQEFTLTNPGGGPADFTLEPQTRGISISPAYGTTPATIRVSVDPAGFQNQKGTFKTEIKIRSASAINVIPPVRVLVNNREPDQRGSVNNIPGKLVDILADPIRDRYYVLRQDRNIVLAFDSRTHQQIGTMRTGNTPTQMAITFDGRYMLIGSDNSQIIPVYDLDTLEATSPVIMPPGHYPRSIACSARRCLVANRVAGPKHKIDWIDMVTRQAFEYDLLTAWENDIDQDTVAVASPNGATVLFVSSNGNTLLYNANSDSFSISRKDFTVLAGSYAASSYGQYIVGNNLLNASLVPQRKLEMATGQASGFVFLDNAAVRTTAPSSSSPGILQRVSLPGGDTVRPTRLAEAPLLLDQSALIFGVGNGGGEVPAQSSGTGTGQLVAGFFRTLAVLPSRTGIVALTTSGVTVLPWEYDAPVPAPRLDRIVNTADQTRPVAPGSLVSILGRDLSPINQTSQQMPLPTALGESCLTANGLPLPIVFVSPSQINAQLPFQIEGNTTLVLRTPGGISDNYHLTVLPAAPRVFRQDDVPAIVRAANNQLVTAANPIAPNDSIVIYLTGMGRTSPFIEAGMPAPDDPPATAVLAPQLSLGGVRLPVTFAGLMPGGVGVYQINAVVPSDVPPGDSQTLTISQGGESTSFEVRVVR